jgi:hypothetical protein
MDLKQRAEEFSDIAAKKHHFQAFKTAICNKENFTLANSNRAYSKGSLHSSAQPSARFYEKPNKEQFYIASSRKMETNQKNLPYQSNEPTLKAGVYSEFSSINPVSKLQSNMTTP